jgi:CRP/FNR family transcriptional regulator, anaerobic regulatory protein
VLRGGTALPSVRREAGCLDECRGLAMQRTTPLAMDSVALAARQGGSLARLLDAFSDAARLDFERMARVRVVAPRTVLVTEGKDTEEVGFLLSGTLATSKLLSDGRMHIVGLLVPTDMYGQVYSSPPRHRIESLSDARLLAIRRAVFEDLLAREPDAERLLLIQALEELDTAREWAVLRCGSKVVNRVASFLVMLASRGKGRPSEPLQVRLHLARADLASYLGTRPETLSRAFHELADRNLIRILDPYHFQLDDFPALVELSEGPLGVEEAER